MDSIDSNPDLELIAAFIDGRLSTEERARAMKLLAESDEALEVFASALQDRADTPAVNVTPIATARRWRQWKVIAPIAAAAMLAIVVVPTLVRRGGKPVSAQAYAAALTQDSRFAAELRPGWDQRWAVTRGGETPVAARPGTPQESRLAFRLGVRSVDLQIALSRGDTALAARLTSEVVETLKGVALSELVAASYADVRTRLATDNRAQSIDRASSAERELRDLLGPNLAASFSFGQWSAAAELAAQAHDASFFSSSGRAQFAQPAGAKDNLGAEDVEALRALDIRTKQGLTEPALDSVREVMQSIIRRRGG